MRTLAELTWRPKTVPYIIFGFWEHLIGGHNLQNQPPRIAWQHA